MMRLQRHGAIIQLETQHLGQSLIGIGTAARLSCYGHEAWYERSEATSERWRQSAWSALRRFRGHHAGKWLFGMMGYDLKNSTEALSSQNPDAVGAPDLMFFAPRWVMRYESGIGRLKIIQAEEPFPESWIQQARAEDASPEFQFQLLPGDEGEKRDYTSRIREAKRDIFEGQYYEINLSRELRGLYSGAPYVLYGRMKEAGPVPFGAFMSVTPPGSQAPIQLCCASPERFLRRQGDIIQSQPIKGTAAVSATGDSAENERIAAGLLHSEKNRAENLMIVDLVRHDLNQVCIPGSVTVPELFGIHRFSTVFQMISTVEGRLRNGVDEIEVLQRCFPMGSMTGAPKIRAMQRIEELETRKRGIYSGSVGYISPEGNMDFNVIIRSAICREGRLFYNVGGAITADSDPEEEWEETLIKAEAIMRCRQPAAAGL